MSGNCFRNVIFRETFWKSMIQMALVAHWRGKQSNDNSLTNA
jgi:hypothetical protein